MTRFDVRKPKGGVTTPLLVHVPHSATAVPTPWRYEIILDDDALDDELLRMTDHYTDELYAPAAVDHGGVAFVNNLSRLVFDPERFEDDVLERMAAKGMGAVYMRTSKLGSLRSPDFAANERELILQDLFRPYTSAVEQQVSMQLDHFGRCLILDGHSFPSQALPYEDGDRDRPDLCLGYVDKHASGPLIAALELTATLAGWRVGHNTPFAGSYIPTAYYGSDSRVVSVMFELNRSLYMDEATGRRSDGFEHAYQVVNQLVATAVLFEAFRNTSFVARPPGREICIRVDEHSLELDALLDQGGHQSWAFITAWNPNGKAVSNEDNLRAQQALEHELREQGLKFHDGAGNADVGDWPPEASALILGVSEEHAVELGRRYGQAAIVTGGRGKPARLMLLSPLELLGVDVAR